MKKFLLFTLITFLSITVVSQSCLPEGITFTTQAQIDSFAINHPNCTDIEGDVEINGADIINLNGLNVLTSIGGNLNIGWTDGTSLIDLSGLESLTSIGGELVIWDALTSLNGLNNLTLIGGRFKISSTISDFTGLENLTSIGGYLFIKWSSNLSSMTGLDNLTSIGGDFYIGVNTNLSSLAGLDNLTSIGGELRLHDNLILNSLIGLDNIESATIENIYISYNPSLTTCEIESICNYISSPNGSIEIHDNSTGCNSPEEVEEACLSHCLPEGIAFTTQAQIDSFQILYPYCTEIEGDVDIGQWELGTTDITNLTGLSVLTSIGGDLSFEQNEVLTTLSGLDNLTSVGGHLTFSGNDVLTNFVGLESLTTIGEGLHIFGNLAVTELIGLNNLTTIGGRLYFKSVDSLTSLIGLENLTTIGGALAIEFNQNLFNLSGLENLTFIGGSLGIYDNPSLSNITGLENVISIGGYLSVNKNYVLTNLTGLENIVAGSILSLRVTDNITLSSCDVQSICDYLVAPNGTIEISDNAPGCNSQLEVEEACETVSIEEVAFDGEITSTPNPFATSTTIEYELQQPEKVILMIYDYLGKQVYQTQENQQRGSQQLVWNAKGFADGIYYYRLQVGDQIANGKMVKVR